MKLIYEIFNTLCIPSKGGKIFYRAREVDYLHTIYEVFSTLYISFKGATRNDSMQS